MIDYLIIGGSTKCATTSLYNYLGDHPSICPSLNKETRFFLNSNYPCKKHFPDSDLLKDYEKFFKNCDTNTIKMEATPDYLYSLNTETKINQLLTNCYFIFILRDPIDRLISWYNFSKQNGLIKYNSTFEEYVQNNLSHKGEKPQHLLAVEQGKYIDYVKKYIHCFGENKIKLITYNELINHSKETLFNICNNLNIDSDFYDDYDFVTHNKTVSIKNKSTHKLFTGFRRKTRKFVNRLPLVLSEPLKKKGASVVSKYISLNTQNNIPVEIKDETKNILKEYYLMSNKELEPIISKNLDWNN